MYLRFFDKNHYKTLLLFMGVILSSIVFAKPINSKRLAKEIYSIHNYTFFCELPIDEDFRIASRSCDLCPIQNVKVKWMAIVPSRRLAAGRLCYESPICQTKTGKSFKGLTCCRKVDKNFIAMEQDLHNIAPEHPRLKYINDHYMVGFLKSGSTPFVCDLRVDDKTKIMQPPPQSRGAYARTYLYFHHEHRLPLSDEEIALFKQWHYAYPPSAWEKERNAQIYALTGKSNSWV